MIKYPSKKFISTTLSILFAVGIVLFVSKIDTNKNNIKIKSIGTAAITKIDKDIKDTDNDGLKNWEEVLWKTDINNPDTDGDGTPDGEEVKVGRNPAIAGPNDKMKSPEELNSLFSSKIKEKEKDLLKKDINLTQYVSEQLMLNYFDSKKQNSDPKQWIKKTMDKLSSKVFSDEFTKKDVQINYDDSPESIKSYINTVGQILKDDFYNVKTQELEIIQTALKTKNYALLENLSENIDAYSKTTNDLKKVRIPTSLLNTGVEMININNNIKISLNSVIKTANDPLSSIYGINYYFANVERFNKITEDINKILKINNITLATKDSGYIFIDYFDKIK
jgi:hypothetical protein